MTLTANGRLHQFSQGIVWLGLYGVGSHGTLKTGAMVTAFVFYAPAMLPLLVLLAIWLIGPRARLRRGSGNRKHVEHSGDHHRRSGQAQRPALRG